MEKLFTYLTNLQKYFILLLETEEAAQLTKEEIKSESFQLLRYLRLSDVCVKEYEKLNLNFDKDLLEFCDAITKELYRRDANGQKQLYAQIMDIIYNFSKKFNEIYKSQGFSEESIGEKSKNILKPTPDGGNEEVKAEFNFSIAMLVDDLATKFNEIQKEINKRFDFVAIKKGQNEQSKTLSELFVDGAYFECMNALRNVNAPVISEDNRYLLGPRQKGAFTAWFEVCKLRQKFIQNPSSNLIAKLLNSEISNLNLSEDGSTLNRNSTTMYKKYYSRFSKLII